MSKETMQFTDKNRLKILLSNLKPNDSWEIKFITMNLLGQTPINDMVGPKNAKPFFMCLASLGEYIVHHIFIHSVPYEICGRSDAEVLKKYKDRINALNKEKYEEHVGVILTDDEWTHAMNMCDISLGTSKEEPTCLEGSVCKCVCHTDKRHEVDRKPSDYVQMRTMIVSNETANELKSLEKDPKYKGKIKVLKKDNNLPN